jgi:hypothetical protein
VTLHQVTGWLVSRGRTFAEHQVEELVGAAEGQVARVLDEGEVLDRGGDVVEEPPDRLGRDDHVALALEDEERDG